MNVRVLVMYCGNVQRIVVLELTLCCSCGQALEVGSQNSWNRQTDTNTDRPSAVTLGVHVQRGLRYLVCLCVCLSVGYHYKAAKDRYQRPHFYVGIVLNGAFILQLFCCKDRAFLFTGHFCLPAYNYTGAYTYMRNPYPCMYFCTIWCIENSNV